MFRRVFSRLQPRRGPPGGSGARGPPGGQGFDSRGPPQGFDPRGRGPPQQQGFDPRGPPPQGFDPRGRGPPQQQGFDPQGFDPRGPSQGFDPRGPPQGFDPRGRGPPQQQDFQVAPRSSRREPEPETPAEPEAPPTLTRPEEPKFLKIDQTESNGVTFIRLNRDPVNALSLEVLRELTGWVHYLGNEDSVKAIVLSSSLETVFSGGLDLKEFMNPQKERFEQFWSTLQETWMLLTSFPKVLVCAVTGNSPAGGCMLAMTADYRIMVDGYRIGLNEVPAGITVPPWLINHFVSIVGQRTAERMLQLGELVDAQTALKIGLVDEVVSSKAEAEAKALEAVSRFMSVPDQGRWMTKDMSRRELFRFLADEEDRNYDREFFTNFVSHKDVQQNIAKHLQSLKTKK